eukprot:gene494-533_t
MEGNSQSFPAVLKDRFGIVYLTKKSLLGDCVLWGNSYLAPKFKSQPPRMENPGEQCFFLDLQAVCERDESALLTVSRQAVAALPQTVIAADDSLTGAVLALRVDAKKGVEIGIAFQSLSEFCSFAHKETGYYREMPDDIELFECEEDQVLFISVKSFVTSDSQLLAFPKHDIRFFPLPGQVDKVKKVNSTLVPNKLLPPPFSFPPAIPTHTPAEQKPSVESMPLSSEGYTTAPGTDSSDNAVIRSRINTKDTQPTQQQRLQVGRQGFYNYGTDSDDMPNESLGKLALNTARPSASSSSSSLAHIAPSQAEKPSKESLKRTSSTAIRNDGVVTKKQKRPTSITRVEGFLEMGFIMPSKRTASSDELALLQSLEEGKDLFNEHWRGWLKEALGWKSVWMRPEGTGYQVPRLNEEADYKVENIHLFRDEEFYLHLRANPCLTFDWSTLWCQLQESGWKINSESDVETVSYIYSRVNTPVPGLHSFCSKAALMWYIARFPYPLQSDEELKASLERHQWPIHNGKFIDPKQNRAKALSLTEVRHLLWQSPQLLFAQYPNFDEERLLASLRLAEKDASMSDSEQSSPEAHARSQERQHATEVIKSVRTKMSQTGVVDPQDKDQVLKAMEPLGWKQEIASWSKAWWKHEKVIVAPYARIEDPVFAVDYFFDMEDVIKAMDSNPTALCYREKKPSFWRTFLDYNNKMHSLEKRIQYIILNSDGNSFEDYELEPMLASAGWKIVKMSMVADRIGAAEHLLFVPPVHSALNIDEDNYTSFQEDVHYFRGLEGLHSFFLPTTVQDDESTDSEEEIAPLELSSSDDNKETIDMTIEEEKHQSADPPSPAPVLSSLSAKSTNLAVSKGQKVSKKSVESESTEDESEYADLDELLLEVGKLSPRFSIVSSLLKLFGWKILYVRNGGNNSVFCPPWTAAIANQQYQAKEVAQKYNILLTDAMLPKVDYFDERDEKDFLYAYVRDHAVEVFHQTKDVTAEQHLNYKTHCDQKIKKKHNRSSGKKTPSNSLHSAQSAPVVEIAKNDLIASPTKAPSKPKKSFLQKAKSIAILDSISPASTDSSYSPERTIQLGIMEEIEKEKPYWPTIYQLLKKLGWKSSQGHRTEQRVIIPPWTTQARATTFKEEHAKVPAYYIVLKHFLHMVDYFLEADDDKRHLMNYLVTCGFERKADYRKKVLENDHEAIVDKDRTFDDDINFAICNRVPDQPLYLADSPDEHIERLAMPVDSEFQSPSIRSPSIHSSAPPLTEETEVSEDEHMENEQDRQNVEDALRTNDDHEHEHEHSHGHHYISPTTLRTLQDTLEGEEMMDVDEEDDIVKLKADIEDFAPSYIPQIEHINLSQAVLDKDALATASSYDSGSTYQYYNSLPCYTDLVLASPPQVSKIPWLNDEKIVSMLSSSDLQANSVWAILRDQYKWTCVVRSPDDRRTSPTPGMNIFYKPGYSRASRYMMEGVHYFYSLTDIINHLREELHFPRDRSGSSFSL